MIEEIEVFVKGRLFTFKNKDFSQEDLEIMWEMISTRIGTDAILSISPHKDILIKATSIDFANKVYDYEEADTHEGN
ncbi:MULTISPECIES: hypothetical protein [unclassified Mammaliicoccus]|uniref:hypothetical protein n=1 Tax=unclassified Mammaliicoccus TaxID=2803851 RepID=UPI001EFB2E60|nr:MULTISPECIES: hypothetical protein [unclassified Mammaliicoccus]